MKLRVIQWNIRMHSDARQIAALLKSKACGFTIINLQEVSAQAHATIRELSGWSSAYSLPLRPPGKHEGRNRQMGMMTLVKAGHIIESGLVDGAVFPERTLLTRIRSGRAEVRSLCFHSLTGVGYYKAKSSNFAAIASHPRLASVDVMCCDANEPDVDALDENEIRFYDNGDRGRKASLLFGCDRVHELRDTHRECARRGDVRLEDGYTFVAGKRRVRYDHIYCRPTWEVVASRAYYAEGLSATSDHGLVISDLLIPEEG